MLVGPRLQWKAIFSTPVVSIRILSHHRSVEEPAIDSLSNISGLIILENTYFIHMHSRRSGSLHRSTQDIPRVYAYLLFLSDPCDVPLSPTCSLSLALSVPFHSMFPRICVSCILIITIHMRVLTGHQSLPRICVPILILYIEHQSSLVIGSAARLVHEFTAICSRATTQLQKHSRPGHVVWLQCKGPWSSTSELLVCVNIYRVQYRNAVFKIYLSASTIIINNCRINTTFPCDLHLCPQSDTHLSVKSPIVSNR